MAEKKMATRDGYAKALLVLGNNINVCVLDADLSGSTKTKVFADAHPQRFFNVGVSEQDMMGTAAGLALSGKLVFASTFAIFATGRAWEQVRNTIAINDLNIKIVATHGGVSVGPDGASHQALEDVAIMRAIPHMKVVVPADGPSAKNLILSAADFPGTFYIRLGRAAIPMMYSPDTSFEIGKAVSLREGKDILIVACGLGVSQALGAAEILATRHISVGVLDMHTIKPIDADALLQCAGRYKKIVTLEEHSVIGGLGSAVAEVLAESTMVVKPDFLRLGVDDQYGQSGDMDTLLEKYHLNARGVAESILAWRRFPVEG